jgi:hypothetical protein
MVSSGVPGPRSAEVGVRRDQYPLLFGSEVQDRRIVGLLQTPLAYVQSVMASVPER